MLSEEELKKEINKFVSEHTSSVKSDEFNQFKKEIMPSSFSFYEKACNFCAKIVSIKADPKKEAELQEAIETCHLNTTTQGVSAFAILFPLAFMLTGIILSFLITNLFMGGKSTMFFIIVSVIGGIALIIPLSTLPKVMANNWRLKASNQMVMSIFYIVSYMRHTSNLELAIRFTSDHIAPPLSLDFKKMMWDVESSKYESMKESVDAYLEKWKKYNPEFVESMHLIQSSLYENTEEKRINSLEKALSLILESTYEKMLHFAQNLKSPITMLHMMGIILPILGLVILPLVVSFMENVEWYYISVFYNIFLPAGVWYMGKVILSTRPTGYGQADITDINPELKKQTKTELKFGKKTFYVDPKWVSIALFLVFFIIGNSPIIMHKLNKGRTVDYIINDRFKFEKTYDFEKVQSAKFSFLGYKKSKSGNIIGPFGLGSTLVSILIPLGLALSLSYYYKAKTKNLMKIREKTRNLEKEFASALFQLGNRIGDGLPAEIAFNKVSEVMEGTVSGKFFDMVSSNIVTLGMGVEEAIFNKKHGAINHFPSALIESSMKVFVESSKKGPSVAAESLINISTYIKEMHRVDERLKDLMAEITSSMTSQINFLAPLISGIVIGLTSMITTILNSLGNQMNTFKQGTEFGGVKQASMLELFGDSLPTFYFQIVVGIYVVQITFILTQMLNTIQNGYDPLNEKHLLGKYIKKSGVLYSTIAFFIILLFNLIAGTVISGLNIVG